MRNLFASETRCVYNILKTELNSQSPKAAQHVATEQYCKPRVQRKGPLFNVDFVLQFVSSAEMPKSRRAGGCPVLPNTIGADLFLLVDKVTDEPLLLHLIAGEAFPIKHYRQHIAAIEAMVEKSLSPAHHGGNNIDGAAILKEQVGERQLAKAARIPRSKYCRLLVIGGDATFLFFPTFESPEMRGVCQTLLDSDAGRIDCYIDGPHVVCFDGWVPVKIVESEYKLEAVWRDDFRQESSGD